MLLVMQEQEEEKEIKVDYLIKILEESIKKHGEKPLTNKWLLNCLKLAQKKEEKEQEFYDKLDYSID